MRLATALLALALAAPAFAGGGMSGSMGTDSGLSLSGGALGIPSLTCSVCVFTSTTPDGTEGFVFNTGAKTTGNLFEIRENGGGADFLVNASGATQATNSLFANNQIRNNTASNGCNTSGGPLCHNDDTQTDGTPYVEEEATPTPIPGYWSLHADADNILTYGDADGVFHPIGGAVPSFGSFTLSTSSSGAHYLAGFYEAPVAEMVLTNAAPTQTLGDAGDDEPWNAHAFVVHKGDGATDGSDLVVTLTGSSITDAGVYTASDSEAIVPDALLATAATDGYLETTKKWVGQVTYTLTSTGGTTFNYSGNYGFAKYDDFGDRDITINEIDCVWHASASTSVDIELLHHEATEWTYHASAFVPGGETIAKMSTDLSGEVNMTSGKQFAWKHNTLAHVVLGDDSEGFVIKVTTGANNAIEHGTCKVGVEL